MHLATLILCTWLLYHLVHLAFCGFLHLATLFSALVVAARQVRFLEALIEPGLVKGSGRIWAWVTWQLPAPEKRQVAKCCKRMRHLASLGLLALGYFQAWKVSRKSGPQSCTPTKRLVDRTPKASWVCCCDRSLEPLNRALSRDKHGQADSQVRRQVRCQVGANKHAK